jgi:hypothetical protein
VGVHGGDVGASADQIEAVGGLQPGDSPPSAANRPAADTLPKEVRMSDDQREREPLRHQADNPPDDGTRKAIGGSSEGSAPMGPGGEAAERARDVVEPGQGEAPARDPLADVEHPTADE